MTKYKRYVGESDDEVIYRICNEKDIIGTWDDVKDILNEILGNDYGESTYRKKYNAFQKMFEANRAKFEDAESRLEELEDKRRAFEREKIKFQDERNAWQRQNREMARVEAKLEHLEELISSTSPYKGICRFTPDKKPSDETEDILICLSDIHFGLDTGRTFFGEYDPDICEKSFNDYLTAIKEIVDNHKIENANIAILGDNVNGIIHYTTILENGENAVEQIQRVSELISDFIFKVSLMVPGKTYVNDVGGNHSRLGKKNEVLRNERSDSLVIWYAKARLKDNKNVIFLDHCKYDPTIGYMNIHGLQFLLCHGDYDSADQSGIQKLVMMIGEVPYGIVMGHKHSTSYSEISGVKMIQSGTFSGSGSNYCIEHRLVGAPSQAVAVVNDSGIKAFYPVQL